MAGDDGKKREGEGRRAAGGLSGRWTRWAYLPGGGGGMSPDVGESSPAKAFKRGKRRAEKLPGVHFSQGGGKTWPAYSKYW